MFSELKSFAAKNVLRIVALLCLMCLLAVSFSGCNSVKTNTVTRDTSSRGSSEDVQGTNVQGTGDDAQGTNNTTGAGGNETAENTGLSPSDTSGTGGQTTTATGETLPGTSGNASSGSKKPSGQTSATAKRPSSNIGGGTASGTAATTPKVTSNTTSSTGRTVRPTAGQTTTTTRPTVTNPTQPTTPKKNYFNLIADTTFNRGVLIGNNRDVATGMRAVNFKGTSTYLDPVWHLGQQHSKFDLRTVSAVKEGNSYVFKNNGKVVKFSDNSFSMELFAKHEYVMGQYEQGNGWPHLQMSQVFEDLPKLTDLDEAILKFDVKTHYLNANVPAGDPHTHTAVFILSVMIQHRTNYSDPGHGDYYWLQFPLADHLNNNFTGWDAPDLSSEGDGDDIKQGTGKYMVSMKGSDYYSGQFGIGKNISINTDIYGLIKRGFDVAKAKGYLAESDFSDMTIASVHWGWEVRGAHNVSSTVSDYSLNVHYKDNRVR